MPPVDNPPSREDGFPRDPRARQYPSSSYSSTFSGSGENDGRSLQAAWDHLRAGAGSDAQLAAGSPVERERQQAALIDWARQAGYLILDAVLQQYPILSNSTSEHEVRYRTSDERVLKVTWPGFYGQIPAAITSQLQRINATPAQYLVRTILHNAVFGGQIMLEGVHVSERPSLVIGQRPGQPSLIVSQPWFLAADPINPAPSISAVALLMKERGFIPVKGSYFGWIRPDGIAVADAKPDNFILTDRGIVPIDLQVAHLDPMILRQMVVG